MSVNFVLGFDIENMYTCPELIAYPASDVKSIYLRHYRNSDFEDGLKIEDREGCYLIIDVGGSKLAQWVGEFESVDFDYDHLIRAVAKKLAKGQNVDLTE